MLITNLIDILLSMVVLIIYLFILKNPNRLLYKYRLILFFEALICIFIQFKRYNSGDLYYYSTSFNFALQNIYYYTTHLVSGGYLLGVLILTLTLIELRLKMLNYFIILDSKINKNKTLIKKFSYRLYIYLFILSPSFNIFLFFQGKDIIAAILITLISISSLENLINIRIDKRLFKKYTKFFTIIFTSSLFTMRIYYLAVYLFGLISSLIYKLIIDLKLNYAKITYKGLFNGFLGLLIISLLFFLLNGISRVDFFLDYLVGGAELQQRFSEFEKASIQLEPWNWPWKIFNILRPLPWNLDKFSGFQKIFIIDHYFAISVSLYLLSRLIKRNKLFIIILSFLLITFCTIFTSNINDMYRRIPVYLMLPIPIVLNFKEKELSDNNQMSKT